MRLLALSLLAAVLSPLLSLAADIAVVRPVKACSPAERGYAAALARNLNRWLDSNGVKTDSIDDSSLAASLKDKKLAFLVMPLQPTPDQIAALSNFSSRGGKLCVFYSASPALASLMRVKLGEFKRPASIGVYSRIDFNSAAPKGCPKHLIQSSSVIFSASPIPGKSTLAASWVSANGKPTPHAAVISSPAGWWMTHVLLADGDENGKARFLLSIVQAASPKSWNAAEWTAKRNRETAAAKALALAQKKRPGEIHAVWDHSGAGLYPGDWPRCIRELKAAGITDLFVNVSGPGFAHYPSSILPASRTSRLLGDQLAACLNAARGSGVRVHAWIICFNATRATPARNAEITKLGWRLKNSKGKDLEYLDPSHPSLRSTMLSATAEIAARYPVNGIHLDFVRWYEQPSAAESTPAALARYRAAHPKPSKRTFYEWRTAQITSFVSAVRSRLKAVRPKAWLTTAVLGKYPSCVDSVGQDWKAWLDAGAVDYIVPMNYSQDLAKYAGFISCQSRSSAHARRTISGIGVTANESRLSPSDVILQIKTARDAGLAGVAFFDLDWMLMHNILPYLKMGMF